jgi:nucleoside-diphosphate-sugar epimerase
MAIMITGGTGFLGSYLARHLVEEKGESGLVLFEKHPNLSRVDDIRDRVTVVQGDVLEPLEVLSAMQRYDVDRVAHLAYILSEPADGKMRPYVDVQCMGMINVFEACRMNGVKRVCFASSAAVFAGHPDQDREFHDDDPPMPDTIYGACKNWGDHIARVYQRKYGLDTVGLRPASVFGLGRGQRGSWSSGLVGLADTPHFMVLPELAALGQPIEMPPDHQVIDWMYAADAAEAWHLILTVENPKNRMFNMVSERRRIGDVTAHLRNILPDSEIGVSSTPVTMTPLLNNDRLVNELGFRARYTMESGMTHYLNMVRERAGLPPVAPV